MYTFRRNTNSPKASSTMRCRSSRHIEIPRSRHVLMRVHGMLRRHMPCRLAGPEPGRLPGHSCRPSATGRQAAPALPWRCPRSTLRAALTSHVGVSPMSRSPSGVGSPLLPRVSPVPAIGGAGGSSGIDLLRYVERMAKPHCTQTGRPCGLPGPKHSGEPADIPDTCDEYYSN